MTLYRGDIDLLVGNIVGPSGLYSGSVGSIIGPVVEYCDPIVMDFISQSN